MWPYDFNGQQLQNMLTQQAPVHITRVNGRAGAEAFTLPPNSDALLLDTSAPIVWLVQTDGAGYKTITAYDIFVHKEVTPEDRYKSLEDRIARLEEALNDKSYPRFSNKGQQQHNDAGGRSNAQGRIPTAIPTEPGKN